MALISSRLKNAGGRTAHALRELLLALRDRAGMPLPGMHAPGRAIVLMYHGVVTSFPSLFNWRHVNAKQFECHLRLLRQHCNVVPLARIFSGDLDPSRLNVAITFDDGFRNNLEIAIPLLRRYGLPASFFVTAANEAGLQVLWPDFLDIAGRYANGDVCIEGRKFTKQGKSYVCADTGASLPTVIRTERPDWPFKQAMYRAFERSAPNLHRPDFRQFWELMSDREIVAAAAQPGVTIGSHGYYHNNLGSLPIDTAISELRQSKAYLENLVQYEIVELAYPDGSYTPDLVRVATTMGFPRQLAVEHKFAESSETLVPARRHGVYSMALARSQLVDSFAS